MTDTLHYFSAIKISVFVIGNTTTKKATPLSTPPRGKGVFFLKMTLSLLLNNLSTSIWCIHTYIYIYTYTYK